MKTFIIIVFILLAFYMLYTLTGKGKYKKPDCLNVENYMLIKESPYADVLCEYGLHREENQIRFTRKTMITLYFSFCWKQKTGKPM